MILKKLHITSSRTQQKTLKNCIVYFIQNSTEDVTKHWHIYFMQSSTEDVGEIAYYSIQNTTDGF
jgi:hypothetical protein